MTGTRALDPDLLRTYLSDHVAAAAAIARRVNRMAKAYPSSPIAQPMAALVPQLAQERAWLISVAQGQHVRLSTWKSGLAVAGEQVGRLKLNGRIVRASPLSPMLELELLGSGLRGKRSVWLTLREWAPELDIDVAVLGELLADVGRQIEQVEQLMTQCRPQALSRS